MTAEELALVKRFEHYCFDRAVPSYESWYQKYSFDEIWDKHVRGFQMSCSSPDWRQRCIDLGLVEFAPYSSEVIDIKLAIFGY